MTVSKREFFDDAHWKEKRYNNVIVQAGKNPTDFEMVEIQDMLNYEQQQLIDNTMNCGFIGDGFKVFEAGTPSTTKIRIYKGRGWVQAGEPTTGGPEYSGIRLELPDVLTNYSTLTYEHGLTGDYYELTITEPNPTGYRYDLVYVKFYRKEYIPNDDPEMRDGVLGETTHREKWYYEFVYQQGDNVIKNPDIAGLTAGEHGVRLAVIVRQDGNVITNGDIWDLRPKFSVNTDNLLNGEVITVGASGGKYRDIYEIFPSQISESPIALPITPAANNPYIIKLLAGLHTCPYQLNIGTTGYIKICGEGADKTILEFDDLYSLMTDSIPWINIGSMAAGATVEFSDLTIRIKNAAYTTNNWLIKIDSANPALPGVVTFANCKIGDLGPAANLNMVYGGLYVSNGYVYMLNCDVNTRSANKQAIYSTGYSTIKIVGSRMRQTKFIAIQTDTTVNGTLDMASCIIHGNDRLLHLNGTSTLSDVDVVKQEWNTGDTVTSNDAVYVVAPTKFATVRMVGPSGKNKLHVSYAADFIGCYNDDAVLSDTVHLVRFYSCILKDVTVTDNTTFHLRTSTVSGTFAATGTAAPYISGCGITTITAVNTVVLTIASSIITTATISATAVINSRATDYTALSLSTAATAQSNILAATIATLTLTNAVVASFSACIITSFTPSTTGSVLLDCCTFSGTMSWGAVPVSLNFCIFNSTATFTAYNGTVNNCMFNGALTFITSSTAMLACCNVNAAVTIGAGCNPTFNTCMFVQALTLNTSAICTFVASSFSAALTLTSAAASSFQGCSFASTITITSTNARFLACIITGDISITTASPEFASCDIGIIALISGAGVSLFYSCTISSVTSITGSGANPIFLDSTFQASTGVQITITTSAAPSFRSCMFYASNSASISMTSAGAVAINSCDFLRDGNTILCTGSSPAIRRCSFLNSGTAQATNSCIIIALSASVPTIDFCRFNLPTSNAGCVGIYIDITTSTPVLTITHSHVNGGVNARLLRASGAVNVQAASLSAATCALEGTNVTLIRTAMTLYT